MKTIKTFFVIPFLFILIVVGACDNNSDNLFFEISPEGGRSVIQQEVQGLFFKFYLLNEKNQPTTIFNEKENIIFSFSIENKLGDDISATTDFIDSNFFRVYKTTNSVDMGKPWTGLWCEYSLSDKKINISSAEISQLSCPWVLTEKYQPDYPICMSESKNYLPIGNYYTIIRLNFHYFRGNEQKLINDVIFKINFKIQ